MHFVIFGSRADYGKIRMNDILEKDNVTYYSGEPRYNSKIQKILSRGLFSFEISKIIFPIFKIDYWKKFFKNEININEPVIFLFEEYSLFSRSVGFINFLKKRFLRAKFVFLYSNNIKSEKYLKFIKQKFDLVITFDRNDSKKFNINYFPSHYSRVEPINLCGEKCDVFFVGRDKGRLGELHELYKLFVNNGLSCDFNIVDVPRNKMIPGIKYNEILSYWNVLAKIKRANVLLEVNCDGQEGPTLRTLEAIAFNKKLLTNNLSLKREKFYNEKYIRIYDKNIDDVEFVKKIYENIDYDYIEKISPKKLLNYIQNTLLNESMNED